MNLDEAVRRNEELTTALLQALAAGDEQGCADLVARRGAALAELEQAVGGATAAERAALEGRLEGLVAADRCLRTAAGTALAEAGEAFRAHCGTASRAAIGPEPTTRPACLDQRA